MLHAIVTVPFWMMVGGSLAAWVFTLYRKDWAKKIQERFHRTNYVLESLYGFDRLNDIVFANGSRKLGEFLWRISDMTIIDQFVVNGSARLMRFMGSVIRPVQTGYLYHYAFFMIIGLMLVLTWVLVVGENPLIQLGS